MLQYAPASCRCVGVARSHTEPAKCRTDVLLAGALERDLGGHQAHKHAHLRRRTCAEGQPGVHMWAGGPAVRTAGAVPCQPQAPPTLPLALFLAAAGAEPVHCQSSTPYPSSG